MVLLFMIVFVVALLPAAATADTAAQARPRPLLAGPSIWTSATITCLGERGATVNFSVTNKGRRAVTIWEFAPTFRFPGPQGTETGLQLFLLIIPSTIAPGETWTYELAIADDLMPPDSWASFRTRMMIDVEVWLLEHQLASKHRIHSASCASPTL